MPRLKKGKNKEDLAPINTLIFPVAIPFQMIFLFFFVIDECQMAASKPKNSKNFFWNSPVKPISGNKINPGKP